MWRYIAAGGLIGLFTSLIVLGFYEAGSFHWLAVYLHGFYAGIPILSIPGSPLLSSPLQYGAIIVAAFGIAGLASDTVRLTFKLIVMVVFVFVLSVAVWLDSCCDP